MLVPRPAAVVPSAAPTPRGQGATGAAARRLILLRSVCSVGLLLVTALVIGQTSSRFRVVTLDEADIPAPGSREVTAHVWWNEALAQRFPDCDFPGVVQFPGSVIEVRGGLPFRVAFDDAWARTHDQDPDNNGEVIAGCTASIP